MKYDATIKHATIVRTKGNDLALELSLAVKRDGKGQDMVINVPSEDLLNTLRFLFSLSGSEDLSDLEGEIINVRTNEHDLPDAISNPRDSIFWHILK